MANHNLRSDRTGPRQYTDFLGWNEHEPVFKLPTVDDRPLIDRVGDQNDPLVYNWAHSTSMRIFGKCCQCGDKHGRCGWFYQCWPKSKSSSYFTICFIQARTTMHVFIMSRESSVQGREPILVLSHLGRSLLAGNTMLHIFVLCTMLVTG